MSTRKGSLETTARELNSAAIHLLRGLAAVDRLAGLTSARLSALSVLVFGGPCTLAELAGAEEVTSATMSRVVDGLVGLGLATRAPHPTSGRKVLIASTDRGCELMLTAQQRRVDVIAAGLDRLGDADRHAVVAASTALRSLAGRIPDEAARAAEAARPR